ncbi:N-formylglutamate amidohydrolase [Pelagibacteraceae bacterium]|nr:N-formylglutamate amidohydrolase [Pelagibacteraceae bacterium]
MSINYKKRILFIADHASNYIPDSLNHLGLTKNLIDTHIAYDLGIRDLCISLSKSCNAKYITGKYSRLIIDLNRDISDPTLIPVIVDKKVIPLNINLSDYERRKRFLKIYKKYHDQIRKIIKRDNINILISLHSFNPIFKNKKRNIHFGILSNQDRKLSEVILDEMRRRKIRVGDNEPYKGNLIGDTMYTHGLQNNIHHSLIEVRNDLLSSSTRISSVTSFLKEIIDESIKRI